MVIRLTLAVLIGTAVQAFAAEPLAGEYQVKGAFLLNFAKFVEWPEQAFKGPDDPIAICVLGQNPFGSALNRAAREIVVANRTVSVRQVSNEREASLCHIVFVSASERKRSRILLEAVQGASVLTVGESEGFIASGGVIDFKVDGEKIRMEISTAAAEHARLRISAKLLSLAQAGNAQSGKR